MALKNKPRVQWINPYITEGYVVSPGTEMPDGMLSEDGGTLVIEHDTDLMLCIDSPLDARAFLQGLLDEVNEYIKNNELDGESK